MHGHCKYISFIKNESDAVSYSFVQVVSIEPKVVCVDTCTAIGQEDARLRVAVQELTPMVPVAADLRALAQAESVDVFAFSDECPEELDFGQCEPSARGDFLQWSAEPSCMSGCTRLRSPCALTLDKSLSLLDRGMPTLCLLDSLSQAGWAGEPKLMVHTSTSPKIFDNRRPLSKKDYLRCIIVLDDLLAAGIVELRSAKPATYYQYILRFKNCLLAVRTWPS